MANKKTELSVVIRAFDKATATIRAIKAKLGALTKPLVVFGGKVAEVGKIGLSGLVTAFKAVGSIIGEILSKIPIIGAAIVGVASAAVFGLKKLVDEFDNLGDAAERQGVSVDFIAQLRYAAETTGSSVESLDAGLQQLSGNLGQLRAGTGRLFSFLSKVSPALLRQLKAAKGNEQAFKLLANAMAKLQDPAKRAVLAQKALGDVTLAPLLAKGADGVQKLRDRFFQLAGSQEGAAREAGKVDDSMKDFKASIQGVKAALVVGLAPAMKVIVDRLATWFSANRESIAKWAVDIGEKIPGAIQAAIVWIEKAIAKVTALFEKVEKIVDKIGGFGKLLGAAWETATSPIFGSLDSKIGDFIGLGSGDKSRLLPSTGDAGAGGLPGVPPRSYGDFFMSPALAKARDLAKTTRSVTAGREDVTGQVQRAREQARPPTASEIAMAIAANPAALAKITIDISGAPRGTRVTEDPTSTADVDLSTGFQMLFGGT